MRRRPLIPLTLALASGIVLGRLACPDSPPVALPVIVGTILCVAATLIPDSRMKPVCVLLSFLGAGIVLEHGTHHPSVLTSLARNRHTCILEGTLLAPARIRHDTAGLMVGTHLLLDSGTRRTVSDRIMVTVYTHIPELRPGERIRFPARLRPFDNFDNPGGYDYESAMAIRGFSCAASVPDGRRIVPMGRGRLPFLLRILEPFRAPVRILFAETLSPRDRALYGALILGERQGIDPDLRELFNRTGMGHVLAVSGLHIGLVAWVSFFLFRWILSRSYHLSLSLSTRKWAAALTCIPVMGYTCMAGFQVSSQRAMVMACVFLWALILDREREVWSGLCLAGMIVLAIDPTRSSPFRFSCPSEP